MFSVVMLVISFSLVNMFASIARFWALPVFCTMIFVPFTYSIANGIAMGLIMYRLIQALTGKWREIEPPAAAAALIFVARYAFMILG